MDGMGLLMRIAQTLRQYHAGRGVGRDTGCTGSPMLSLPEAKMLFFQRAKNPAAAKALGTNLDTHGTVCAPMDTSNANGGEP
jgi:hypothetical protein